MRNLISLLIMVTGLVVGNWLPDIDQRTNLLVHRSIMTHGPLIPLIGWTIAVSSPRTVRWFVIGLSIGTAIHLCFDLFPRGWQGFALIAIPAFGRTHPIFSWLWIGFGTLSCLYLAAKLVRTGGEQLLFYTAIIASFVLTAFDEEALWRPIAAIIVAALLCTKPAFTHPEPRAF